MSYTLPEPPFYLACLSRDDKLHTTRLNNATVAEAGKVARQWSTQKDVFIVIHDSTGARQGAFLAGTYYPSDTPEDEMIQLAKAWQAERREN